MKRKREREILQNFMEVLANNYQQMEPEEMSNSICQIYNSLHGTVNNAGIWQLALTVFNTGVCILVLFVNLFRRKA